MRIGMLPILCCLLLFALLFAPFSTVHAHDGAFIFQASDESGGAAADDAQPLPPFDPADDDDADPALPDPAATISETVVVDEAMIAPAALPPLLVGQNGGQTIMIASDQSGDPVSVIKFTPGLDDPLQPAQQMETIIDLGIGVNAQMTWDFTGNLFTFSFTP